MAERALLFDDESNAPGGSSEREKTDSRARSTPAEEDAQELQPLTGSRRPLDRQKSVLPPPPQISHKDMEHRKDLEEYEEITREATVLTQLDGDVWGAMICVLEKDFPDIIHNHFDQEQLLRLCFVAIVGLINLGLHCAFLIWIGTFVMLPSIKIMQDAYQVYHKVAFTYDATFDGTGFEDHIGSEKADLCGSVLGNIAFLFAALFLWMCRGAHEISKCLKLRHIVNEIPMLPDSCDDKDQVYEQSPEEGGKIIIVCLGMCTRLVLIMIVVIPKIVIGVALLLMWLIWLTASNDYADLILNSLALGFVLDVDSLLYECFLPSRLHATLKHMFLALPDKHPSAFVDEEQKDQQAVVKEYMGAIGMILMCIGLIAGFLMYQPIIPGFDWDITRPCSGYILERQYPWCHFWEEPLMGCFPHGQEGSHAQPKDL